MAVHARDDGVLKTGRVGLHYYRGSVRVENILLRYTTKMLIP
jgi:hypothetical protein